MGDWKPSDQSLTKWLDINAFSMAPLGTFGNCSVGVARAPSYTNVDAVLSKRFNTGGPTFAEIRVEAFNVLQPPELRAAGARHLGTEHVRDDHEHDQFAARDRAGLQVLVLRVGVL